MWAPFKIFYFSFYNFNSFHIFNEFYILYNLNAQICTKYIKKITKQIKIQLKTVIISCIRQCIISVNFHLSVISKCLFLYKMLTEICGNIIKCELKWIEDWLNAALIMQ